MPKDIGHDMTDEMLSDLEKKVNNVYKQAADEMQSKVQKELDTYAKKLAAKEADLAAGKISKKEFNSWKKGQAAMLSNKTGLADNLAKDLVNSDQIAASLISGHTPGVYALNHNYGTYQVESGLEVNTSYVLYDQFTVENLLRENPDLLPQPKINIPKDMAWNKSHITNAITQGVLQGESIPDIAKRLRTVVGMDHNAAIRNARTATTGAQNAGRIDSYKRAQNMGIDLQKEWMATLDGRTRHTHRELDGQRVDIDASFEVEGKEIEFPGDPHAHPSLVYNCRCTLVPVLKGFERPSDWKQQTIDYAEWKKGGSGFSKWLEDQAAPDSAIQSVWADKKYSFVYNLMKNSDLPGHGADANNFFNALKKLGQDSGIGAPPKVWNAYLTGQLDAEDLKTFEDIIKKYLPKQTTAAPAHFTGKLAKEAQDQLDNLKFTPGKPMTVNEADGGKVNPFYNKFDDATKTNCQTSAYAYECRMQGYDVVALPKYEGLSDFDDVVKLQKALGADQSVGWINKATGKHPEKLLGNTKNAVVPKTKSYQALDDLIGNNGERYTLSLNLESGAHTVNIDRDAHGMLRIIDNQLDAAKKNTWTGAEIFDFLDDYEVKNIKALYRVDDCVPNSSIFNKVVVDSKKVKTGFTTAADLNTSVEKELIEYCKDLGVDHNQYFLKWKNGMADDPVLDNMMKNAAIKGKTKASINVTASTVDMDLLKTKKVSKVWNELKDQGGTAYSQFWKTVGDAGKDYGLEKKQSKVWDLYINGKLKPEESKKIDDFLLKHYFNTADDVVKAAVSKSDDIIKLEKQIDKIDKTINDLEKNPSQYKFALHGKVQDFDNLTWNLSGNTEEKLQKIISMGAKPTNTSQKLVDLLDEKQNLKGQILSLQNKAKTTVTKSDDLIKAEAKLKKAQDALDSVSNPTYSGIWKDDVTLADYEAKKGTIKAKKIYYEDEIDKLKNDSSYKSWLSDEDKQYKIWDLQHHLDDLEDFETEGKKYAKLQKAVADAQTDVRSLTPVGEAYTEERKANALWVKTKSGKKFDEADAYYDSVAAKVHGVKTKAEHEGYYHYTWGSGPFNQPLAGFDGSWSNPSPLGAGKFDIDKNGYGDKIRGLTSLCEKSKYDRDFWCQTGQDEITLESFLGIKPGTLANMTEAEAQQFVGVQNEIPQFISTAINKGGGAYNPGDMTFNIYVPEGSEALYVREDGHFGKSEHEMILQRGGTYKVSRLYKAPGLHGSNEWIVDLEVHPEYGYDKFQQTK